MLTSFEAGHQSAWGPVRGTDPLSFFEAKLRGDLGAERAYERIVTAAKRTGMRG